MRVDCHAPAELIPLPPVEQEKQVDWQSLPPEMWSHIGSFLPLEGVSSMMRVSHKMEQLMSFNFKKFVEAWIKAEVDPKKQLLKEKEFEIEHAYVPAPKWLHEMAIRNTDHGQKIRNLLYKTRSDLFARLVGRIEDEKKIVDDKNNIVGGWVYDIGGDWLTDGNGALAGAHRLADIFQGLRPKCPFSEVEKRFFAPLKDLMFLETDYEVGKVMCLEMMIRGAEDEEHRESLGAVAEALAKECWGYWGGDHLVFLLARSIIESGDIFRAARIFCDPERGELTEEALGQPITGSLAGIAVVPSAEEAEEAVKRARELLRGKSPHLYTLEEKGAAAVLKIDAFLEGGWAESIRRWRAEGFDGSFLCFL